MTRSDEPGMLMRRASRLLARRSYSRGDLRTRLLRSGDEQAVEAVLDHLEELRLLNDSEYAYNFALDRITHEGWGPLKVLRSLLRRQVAASIAELALERVRREYRDEDVLKEYIHRHTRKRDLPRDRKGLRRLMLHLKRRGFREETVYRCLREIVPASLWRGFETGE